MCIGLRLDRALLYPRVDKRVDKMIEAGFVNEVRRVLAMRFDRHLPSLSGLGYLEIAAHLLDGQPLDAAIERTKFSTHEFIRRQDVWFRGHDNGILWHNVDQLDRDTLARTLLDLAQRVTQMLQTDGANPNPFIGLILLIVLVIFVMPDRLPQFLSDLSPYLFSGIPCARLPAASELAAHQSVIGRSVRDPLRLELAPTAIDDDGGLLLRLTVINGSLGTVPIVFQVDNIAVVERDDETDGFGIIIDPAPAEGLKRSHRTQSRQSSGERCPTSGTKTALRPFANVDSFAGHDRRRRFGPRSLSHVSRRRAAATK